MTTSRRRLAAVLSLWIILVVMSGTVPDAAAAASLLAQGGAEHAATSRAATNPGGALRSRAVALSADALGRVRAALTRGEGQQTVALPLFADAGLNLQLERIESTHSGGTALIGRVEGDPLGVAILVENPDAVSFNISTGGRRFRVTGSRTSGFIASELDVLNLPEHDRPVPEVSGDDGFVKGAGQTKHGALDAHGLAAPAGGALRARPRQDTGETMDVMVVYTNTARANAGGTAQMRADIDAQIVLTNLAYANSGVVQRVRLVYRGEVTLVEGDPSADLDKLRDPADGVLDQVHTLRDLYAADFVSLWGIYPQLCGLGYVMTAESAGFANAAFNLVYSPVCTVGNNVSFAHELGHNMGLKHDPFMDSANTRLSPEGSATNVDITYAHGYVDDVNRFRTVMGYNDKCTVQGFSCKSVPYFSNPAVTFNNNAFYAPAVTATTGEAVLSNESLALNNTRETSANFRQSLATLNGPGTVALMTPVVKVAEAAGSVSIAVSRHAGSVGAIAVNYSTVAGTATAGADFTATTGTLSWADGELADKIITVPIVQDALLEGSESFTVVLSNATNGATIATVAGVNGSSRVDITDDEADTWPPGRVVPGNYVNAAAPADWSLEPDDGYLSPTSLRSAAVLATTQGTYVYSTLSVTNTFVAGNVSFAYRVSAGLNFGDLEFLIDDVPAFVSVSGETGWLTTTVPVPAGSHKLTWRFRNKLNFACTALGSINCADRVWIDQVQLPLPGASLSILKGPFGEGLVIGDAGISCGTSCVTVVPVGTQITLNAIAQGFSVFEGWSGSGCAGTTACTLVVTGNQFVTANFVPTPEEFPPGCQFPPGWITPAGATTGWQVAGDRTNPGQCSLKSSPMANAPGAGQANRAQVQVTGTYDAGSVGFAYNVSSQPNVDCLRFLIDGIEQAGMGSCSGSGGSGFGGETGSWGLFNAVVPAGTHTFTWSYEKNESIVAGADAAWLDSVTLPPLTRVLLTITKDGTGTGLVGTKQNDCGGVCSMLVTPGTPFSLNAKADPGSVFAGWSGGGCSGTGNCVFTPTGPTTINATFNRTNALVSVVRSGTGTGDVVSSPAGIATATGATSASFTIGVPVTLTASATGNSVFAGWSGGTCSGTAACTFTPSVDVSVTATFTFVASAPSAPTLTLVTPGNGRATLFFLPPASNGGSPITGYNAQCNAVVVSGSGSPITVTGLTNGGTTLCRVAAVNAVGATFSSNSSLFQPSATPAPGLVDARSRHVHAGLGAVDFTLTPGIALGGAIAIEPRATGVHQLVLQLNTTIASVAGAAVTDALGAPAGTASVGTAGDTATVNVSLSNNGVGRVTVTLLQVNGTTNVSVPVAFLPGDVSGNYRVNAADIAAIKARIGQAVTAGNARFDVNGDGGISQSDVQAAKSRAGRAP